MGQCNSMLEVFTLADRTLESRPTKTSVTRPKFHLLRGRLSSKRSTRSPTQTFCWSFSHFSLSVKVSEYSLILLFQKTLVRYWTFLHCFLPKWSPLTRNPGGNPVTFLCSKKWLGVNASKSAGSSEAAKIGWFMMNSTSVNKCHNANSLSNLSSHNSLQVLLCTLHQSFPDSGHVHHCRRVKSPLHSFLLQFLVDLSVVPASDCIL